MKMNRKVVSVVFAVMGLTASLVCERSAGGQAPDGAWHSFDSARENGDAQNSRNGMESGDPTSAAFPIVYRVDDGVPGPRGYRYFFYGNGFFINKEGYLLTAAHVLSQLHGGQPYLLVRNRMAGPHFVEANVIALDEDHDVALLQATPNPFTHDDAVSTLALAPEGTNPSETVEAASAMPPQQRDAYSFDDLQKDLSPGKILGFEFSQLSKAPVDTELFLFNHTIQPGQSGAPVVEVASGAASGIVEGQWLRGDSALPVAPGNVNPTAASGTDTKESAPAARAQAAATIVASPGAAVPIHYAIALLERAGVSWDDASSAREHAQEANASPSLSQLPKPLSLVPARYPTQSLFGGEVLLDALVERNGTISDVKVVHGQQPFLAKAIDAVSTWTFVPAYVDGQASERRIAVAFEFPQPYNPPREPATHEYESGTAEGAQSTQAADAASRAVKTVEPEYPSDDSKEGNVILYETIDGQGRVASERLVQDGGALTASTVAAAKEWKFDPARSSGATVESAAILSVTFRHALATTGEPRLQSSQLAQSAQSTQTHLTQTQPGQTRK